jgi:hypothetical protein
VTAQTSSVVKVRDVVQVGSRMAIGKADSSPKIGQFGAR